MMGDEALYMKRTIPEIGLLLSIRLDRGVRKLHVHRYNLKICAKPAHLLRFWNRQPIRVKLVASHRWRFFEPMSFSE